MRRPFLFATLRKTPVDMLDHLNDIEAQGLAELTAASDADAVEQWRIQYLGTKGKLKAAMPLSF